MICSLCGRGVGRYPMGTGIRLGAYDACEDCLVPLVENEIDRRQVRADAAALADGQSGDDRLGHLMAQAQRVK